MVPKDYYLILGVPRQASQNGIRDAYRSLAKQCHPDLAGESGTPDFQNINEAYEVLSDPDQRRSYNRSLERAERAGDDGGRASGGRSAPSGGRSAPHRRSRHRWDDGPPPYQRSGRRGRRFLDVEVILNPAEATWGVTFDLEVPWLDRCPLCRGTGWEGPFPCFGCDGAGMIRRDRFASAGFPCLPVSGTGMSSKFSFNGSHPSRSFCGLLCGFDRKIPAPVGASAAVNNAYPQTAPRIQILTRITAARKRANRI